jgi:hypothetical protein
MLPFQVAVSGQGDQYQVAPRVSGSAVTQNLGKTAREAISGAVGQQLLQRVGLGQATTTATQESGATTASQPAQEAPAVDAPGGKLLSPVLKQFEKSTKRLKK